MDKAWVNLPRMTEEYKKAVQKFVYGHAKNKGNPEKIICPCSKCRNLIRHSSRDVVSHLICFGIDPTYDVWIFHGETRPSQNEVGETTYTNRMHFDAQNEEPSNSVVAECITKIKKYNTQSSQRTIPLFEDGVAKIFGPERSGRVRGLGFGVTPSQLGVHMSYSKKLCALTNRVTELQNRVQELTDLIMSMVGKENLVDDSLTSHATTPQSDQSSTNFANSGNTQTPEVSKKCKLLNWQKKVVAEGTIASTDPNALVHNVPLGTDVWEVWIDVSLDPRAPLWRSNSEMSIIQQAIGTSVAWHKDYVSLD